MVGAVTTIKITPGVKQRLDNLRRFPRESYNEIISRLTMENEEEGITEEDILDIEEALEDIKAGRIYSTAQLKEKLGLDWMSYTIIWTDKARKTLEKIPKDIAARIIERIEIIRDDPFLHIDRLAGSAWYNYRVGSYRVILDIRRTTLIVYVIKIGQRKVVYRNLE